MNIIYHSDKNTVSSFSHRLASILGIKASRARELHAKTLEYNSNNHLIAHLAKYGSDTGVSLERYFFNLSELLSIKHKKPLDDEMKALIESELSSDISELYKNVQMDDFIRFALINDGCSKSLAGFDELETYAYTQLDNDMHKHVLSNLYSNTLLVAALDSGASTDDLETIFFLHCNYLGHKPKKSTSQLFQQYVRSIHENLSSKLVHTYVVPMIARVSSTTRELGLIDLSAVNEICTKGNRIVYLAKKAEPGSYSEFEDGDIVSAYCHPSGLFDSRKKSEYAIQVLPPKESASQIAKYNRVPMFIAGGSEGTHFHIIDTLNSDDIDAFKRQTKADKTNPDMLRGQMVFYPVTVIGQELAQTQIRALNSVFANMCFGSRKNGLDVVAGTLVTDMFSGLVSEDMGVLYNRELMFSSLRMITEMHQSWFELFPKTKWVFEAINYCHLTFVSKDNMYSPFGQYNLACHIELGKGSINSNELDDERFIDRNVWLYALHQYCKNPVTHSVVVYDNLANDEYGTNTQRFVRSNGMPATTRKVYDKLDDIHLDYDFSCVHNLISCYERYDMAMHPFNLVGFNAIGEQIINITIYPFTVSYQAPHTQAIFNFIRDIYGEVSGAYKEIEIEEFDSIGLGNGLITCLTPNREEFDLFSD
nr:hypothetical protein [Vibrio splendidus]MCC4880729.1 hypothetical protein [Vibrio splendidus]